jgi:hypothetical protein
MKLLSVLAFVSLAALAELATPALASCSGSGYSRLCDGLGLSSGSSSRPSANGLTDHIGINGGMIKTVIRNNPGASGGSGGLGLQIMETMRY